MKNVLTGIRLLAIAIINSGCPKPCVESSYSFAVSSQINPDIDSVRVGDTVFLSSSFSNRLTNQSTGMTIDYSGASDIESTLSIAELIPGDSIPKGSVYDFKYASLIGIIYNSTSIPSPETVQQLKYQEAGNNYQLKIGLIPQRKGVFALGIGNGLSNARAKSGKCEKASFDFTLANTSQHIYFFKSWRPGYNLSPSDTLKLYCFKVY